MFELWRVKEMKVEQTAQTYFLFPGDWSPDETAISIDLLHACDSMS